MVLGEKALKAWKKEMIRLKKEFHQKKDLKMAFTNKKLKKN